MTGVWIVLELLGIGVLTGLRTMTPMAVLCWMMVLGRLPTPGGWTGFVGSKISAGIFSLGAIGELIGDKLSAAPDRTKPPGLVARMALGGLAAAILAGVAGGSLLVGAILGMIGAGIGTFGGWFLRTRIVAALHCKDWRVALVEDAIAVCGSIWMCSLLGR